MELIKVDIIGEPAEILVRGFGSHAFRQNAQPSGYAMNMRIDRHYVAPQRERQYAGNRFVPVEGDHCRQPLPAKIVKNFFIFLTKYVSIVLYPESR